MLSKLQYISQGETPKEQLLNILSALDAGCNWVQLRYKNRPQNEVRALAEVVKKSIAAYNCTFIVNDFTEVAMAVDADGVHLGLNDGPVTEARRILGPNKIIGGTANTLQHLRQRIAESCDYIGLGPYRFTTTKAKLSPILGLYGYENLLSALNTDENSIPVYAIGGIGTDDIEGLMAAGLHGIALSGTMTQAAEKQVLISRINMKLYGKINNSQQAV